MAEQNENLGIEVGGQKLNYSGQNLNTLATVLTLMMMSVLLYIVWSQTAEMKEMFKSVTTSMNEMTIAAREQNCLITLPTDDRSRNAEMCKRIAR